MLHGAIQKIKVARFYGLGCSGNKKLHRS